MSASVNPSQTSARPWTSSQRNATTSGKSDRSAMAKKMSSLGSCNICKIVGHRSNECPLRVCYNCNQQGHYAAECKEKTKKATNEACQVSGTKGTVFSRCPNCVKVREMLRNEKGGDSGFILPN
ncbi:cellular nucleic acid-binding protein homolog [Leptopilina heterotoma]|uniref:cellular nucleic acid-binding protein homolog n=1 Tax=Leptopilina heterotoma TaxID=63436 RepID=UPI001CA88003|nr:cellular nucleic acid-binding protein homolog [Leptopilina heterotoma]